MSNYKRVIPCLDVDAGRVVKGVNFVDIQDAGDPVEIAQRYCQAGADELTFLDITASTENRGTTLEMVEKLAAVVTIPLIVGGGINSCADIERLLAAGASKVSINSAAVKRPELIQEAAQQFGSKTLIVALDVKQVAPAGEPERWEIFTQGGKKATGLDAIEWAQQVVALGAGELLVTSMDRDGTKNGFDLAATKAIAEATGVPVIASGGVGSLEHLAAGILEGKADAVLAASIFHFGEFSIPEAKQYLASQGIAVKL